MTVKVTKPAINVREELADLRKPTGIAGEAMLRAETPQEQFNLIGAGRRNLIINGDVQINQRNLVNGGNVGNAQYTVDRWVTVASGTSNTSIVSGNDNNSAIRMSATQSGAMQICHEQKIENPSRFSGKTITASCMVRSDSNLPRINIYDSNWSGLKSAPHSGSGEWELLTVTGTLASNQSDLRVRLGFSDQGNVNVVSGTYFDFTEVQLELGKVATPFEHRSYGEELAACQRYCQTYTASDQEWIYIEASTADFKWWQIPLKTQMRADPSVTYPSVSANIAGGAGTITSQATGNASVSRVSIRCTCSGTGGTAYQLRHTDGLDGSVYILSAEL
jgi:hypothetical protein